MFTDITKTRTRKKVQPYSCTDMLIVGLKPSVEHGFKSVGYLFQTELWRYFLTASVLLWWNNMITNGRFELVESAFPLCANRFAQSTGIKAAIITPASRVHYTSPQLSNLWWIPNSVSKGFDAVMKTGSSRRFKRYPSTYMWVSSWLPFTVD